MIELSIAFMAGCVVGGFLTILAFLIGWYAK